MLIIYYTLDLSTAQISVPVRHILLMASDLDFWIRIYELCIRIREAGSRFTLAHFLAIENISCRSSCTFFYINIEFCSEIILVYDKITRMRIRNNVSSYSRRILADAFSHMLKIKSDLVQFVRWTLRKLLE